ncbi:MAG: fibronectin type III domain-containing protein [Planctomycetes bacterium]|nr:fibronectin type III domain-containing protein [Planctomycetota bacterium]MCB9891715.1 fibronectin type III domain-containing protein [Planctomycetota bacterium]MCB9918728.1 fibronectin type III domain-containing protein [Planctomycetota bacterium]
MQQNTQNLTHSPSSSLGASIRAGLVLAVAAAAAFSQSGAGEGQRPERLAFRPTEVATGACDALPGRVVVKFVDGARVRLHDGRLKATQPTAQTLDHVESVIDGARVERLFTASEADLDRERAELMAAAAPTEAPFADLAGYYRVACDPTRVDALVRELLRDPLVETAYPEPAPVPFGDLPPTTPQLTDKQGYFADAPTGYGYARFDSIVGMRAHDASVAHIEGSWITDHEDLAVSMLGNPPSGGYLSSSWLHHGTACAGILAAPANGYGVRGFASAAKNVYVVSISNGTANAIQIAASRLKAGSVMTSSYGFANSTANFPLDFNPAEFDAVRAATAKGIFYVFSAGNSGKSLDDTAIYGTRYLPSSPSSGGFIIGATEGSALTRASFSNYGTRIDANGWGRNVTTLGYGDLFYPSADARQSYTAVFNGTSSAAPTVAGTIASYVGAVREQRGVTLTPAAVRSDLAAIGTDVPGGQIGRRPDLARLLSKRGLPDGLLVTDHGKVGGAFTMQVSGQASTPFVVVLSTGRARLDIGLNRPLLLDPSGVFHAVGNLMATSGTMSVRVPLPNDKAIDGARWFLQGGVNRSSRFSLTNSAELRIDGTAASATPPNAPQNLRVDAKSASAIRLRWDDASNNEDRFVVRFSTDGKTFVDKLSVSSNTTTGQINGLAADTLYWFRVAAENAAGRNATAILSVRTDGAAPRDPSGVALTALRFDRASVRWTDQANNESNYEVALSTDGVNYTRVAALGANTTTATVTGLAPNRKYWIGITATNRWGRSARVPVSFTTPDGPPTAPTGLRIVAARQRQFDLVWSDTSGNEQGFHIGVSTDGTNWTRVLTVGANVTAATITNLAVDTHYHVRVRAYNAADASAPSVTTGRTLPRPPDAPTNIRITEINTAGFRVTFQDNSSNEDGFRIETRRRDITGANWIVRANLPVNDYDTRITGLKSDKPYDVRVIAFNKGGETNSAIVATRTK